MRTSILTMVAALAAACSVHTGAGEAVRPTEAPAEDPPLVPTAEPEKVPRKLRGEVKGVLRPGLIVGDAATALPLNDGVFEFPRVYFAGDSYALAVIAEPRGETCAIENATGTFEEKDTLVKVTCSPYSYSVGGVVSGLVGDLVLFNNFADQITVHGDGSFVFPHSIPSGAGYFIDMGPKQGPLSQTCVLTHNVGMILDDNVQAVKVECVTDSFPIEVHVHNLVSGALLLRNGPGSDIHVPAGGGVVSFPVHVLDGEPYHVEIVAQPAPQTCSFVSSTLPDGVVMGGPVHLVMNCE